MPLAVLVRHAVRQAALIALVGGLLGVVANSLAPWRIAWAGERRQLAAATDSMLRDSWNARDAHSDTTGAQPLSVSLDQAKRLWDAGDAVFVDARPPYEFGDGYIPRAINIPYEEIEYYGAEIAELPQDEILVVYCAGESCDLSIHLGDALVERGFARVRVFFGGWNEWKQAGYPIERPGSPSASEGL